MAATPLAAQEARQELYDIIRGGSNFDEKAQQALELGKRYLQADNGHLTHIDEETDHWEALFSTDAADGQFPPGLTLDLGTTYCRRTIAGQSPISLHDAPTQGWADDPAFEEHGLHCYHGTTLIVDGEAFGTICFVSEEPRDAFSESETMFAELLTRLLERERERANHEAQLTRQSNLATVLNRVLRHNLRNDMTVIRGYTQMMKAALDDDTYPDKAMQKIDELLAISEKARELERIMGETFDREPTDIGDLVEQSVARYQDEYPTASFTVEIDDNVEASIYPTFERAIAELIDNAAKHGGTPPTVEIAVKRIPNAIEIDVGDNGPGIDNQERKVLSTGIETPLIHGSGLGLWIVHWIVSTHGGSVKARVANDGTTLTLAVPHGPEFQIDDQVTELQRARDRYAAAFHESLDAMFIVDDNGRVLDANPAAEAIYDVSPAELLGRSIPEFLPDGFDFSSAWDQFQTTGADRGTVTVVSENGVKRRVEYTAKADVVPGRHFMSVRPIPTDAD